MKPSIKSVVLPVVGFILFGLTIGGVLSVLYDRAGQPPIAAYRIDTHNGRFYSDTVKFTTFGDLIIHDKSDDKQKLIRSNYCVVTALKSRLITPTQHMPRG